MRSRIHLEKAVENREKPSFALAAGRRIMASMILVVLILASHFKGELSGAAEKHRLILATATTGGTYYPVGVAIAMLTTNNLEGSQGISITAITSAGSGRISNAGLTFYLYVDILDS